MLGYCLKLLPHNSDCQEVGSVASEVDLRECTLHLSPQCFVTQRRHHQKYKTKTPKITYKDKKEIAIILKAHFINKMGFYSPAKYR